MAVVVVRAEGHECIIVERLIARETLGKCRCAAPTKTHGPVERLLPELTIALWIFLIAGLTVLGSDLMWAVAMGDVIRETGTVPHRIPFASAPQGEWHNPIAVAQVLLSIVNATGTAGLAAFHLVLVALTLAIVLAESRRLGSSAARASAVLSVVVLGCASPFVVMRLPDLSLVMFVISVALMRRQHDHASGRVWWLVPLFAIWGNLHGGVLVGVAVFGVFLVVSKGAGSVLQRLALAATTVAALMLTSAGLGTPSYYLGVLGNEAATRGSDLWAAPDLGDPLDLTMLAAAVTLLILCLRRGLPAWEWLPPPACWLGRWSRPATACGCSCSSLRPPRGCRA